MVRSLRKLKHHEKKLLKKVDFLNWKSDSSVSRALRRLPMLEGKVFTPSAFGLQNTHEAEVIRRYHIQKREDYVKSVLKRVGRRGLGAESVPFLS